MTENERIMVFQWPSLSPELNLTEMLWQDLVYEKMPAKFKEVKRIPILMSSLFINQSRTSGAQKITIKFIKQFHEINTFKI